jgi:uncharacterized membrane protein required for colicin V production
MNIVDVFILIFVLIGGFLGFKRGAVKEFVSAIGFFVVVVLSFLLKNPLSVIFYENLPFFKFGGVFKGVTALNIALYELLAFLVAALILTLLWKLVGYASSIVQKLINMTFILGLPSKIIGFIIGVIEYYVLAFIIIYILTIPIFNVKEVVESKGAQHILNDTPVISGFVKNSAGFIGEFIELRDKYQVTESANQFNYETLDLFMKYDIVDVKSVKKLKEKNKIKIDGIENLIQKYEEEK